MTDEEREKERNTPLAAKEPGLAEILNLEERFLIRVPARHNARLQTIIQRVNRDDNLYILWQIANNNAVRRLGMSDHGPIHVQIVTNIALKLLRLLAEKGIKPNCISDYRLSIEEAEVIVVLGALLHDVGISIHRHGHEQYSLLVAGPKLKELLDGLYDVAVETVLRSEILHAIISHRADSHPSTLEAGIVRVADALDMEEGRTRIPFQAGKINIHSVSAASIERIRIKSGETKPIQIIVEMSNSAGIFQLDELLKNKLVGSGLEPYVDVDASIKGEAEKKLIHTFRI